jgi:hypothetical protein
MATAKKLTEADLPEAASLLGARSYKVRVERLGMERIREIARENGRKNGAHPGGKES